MRQAGAEKLETIRLVENSELSVTVTLRELGVSRSTFYGWYRRYRDRGVVGRVDRHSGAAFTGTGYRTGYVSKWSTRPWPIRRPPRGSWPGRSQTPQTTSSPSPACTGS